MNDRTITIEQFHRIKNDVNGNPRYVLHFLNLNTDAELSSEPWISTSEKYALALARSRKAGGKKFSNKQYGGGIVFQSYSLGELCAHLNALRGEK